MTGYRLTRSAREDLIDIWLYTEERWGEAQADDYQDALHACCERIAAGLVRARALEELGDIRSVRCRHHHLFFIEQDAGPIILAVFHEKMDLIERLRERL